MSGLRIGTRGSPLALAQSALVKRALEKANPGLEVELVTIRTSGDDFTPGAPSAQVKGLFVKEIEEALLARSIDLAVHSVKDLEAELPAGLAIAAVPKRADPRDALVTPGGKPFAALAPNAVVAASSLRRQAQLKRLRRDLEFCPIRGNVDTRLRKLEAGECGALVLAAAGLERLGLEARIAERFEPEKLVPSPGQGALALEARADDKETARIVSAIDDPDSHSEVEAERAFLKALGGGCSVPIGALARVQDGLNMSMSGVVLSPDGLKAVRKSIAGPRSAAARLGIELASHLRAGGADRLLYGHWAEKGKG